MLRIERKEAKRMRFLKKRDKEKRLEHEKDVEEDRRCQDMQSELQPMLQMSVSEFESHIASRFGKKLNRVLVKLLEFIIWAEKNPEKVHKRDQINRAKMFMTLIKISRYKKGITRFGRSVVVKSERFPVARAGFLFCLLFPRLGDSLPWTVCEEIEKFWPHRFTHLEKDPDLSPEFHRLKLLPDSTPNTKTRHFSDVWNISKKDSKYKKKVRFTGVKISTSYKPRRRRRRWRYYYYRHYPYY